VWGSVHGGLAAMADGELTGLCHLASSRHRSSLWYEEEEEGVEDVLTMDLFGRRSDGIWPLAEFNGGDILSMVGRGFRRGEEELIVEKY
jgi:hypothetical protein